MNVDRSPEEMLSVLMQNDAFSKWLGLYDIEVGLGFAKFKYNIIPDMMNGVGSVHGGILFSAADSALAFASNSYDNLSVAMDVSINFTKAAQLNDIITVEANEVYGGKKTAVYDIKSYNQDGKLICLFKGTVFRTGKKL